MTDINTSGRYSGMDFKEFHKHRMARYTGLANQKGTNFDHFIYAKDVLDWNWYLALNEQHKALEIDYAHGMELDDWGDDVDVRRNGMDDPTYRFLIKSKRLSLNSKGTFGDIINIAANLLGCSTDDVTVSNVRHWEGNQLVGEENTISVDNINIVNVQNTELIPLLSGELENSTLASTKVKDIGFYGSASEDIRLFLAVGIGEHMTIPIDDSFGDDGQVNVSTHLLTIPAVTEHISI